MLPTQSLQTSIFLQSCTLWYVFRKLKQSRADNDPLCTLNSSLDFHSFHQRDSPCFHRPTANMATISPKRTFSVATAARGWLPVFTIAVAGKTAASRASFPLRWLNTVSRAVSGNSRDGECFNLHKQTWRRKSNGTQKTISQNLLNNLLNNYSTIMLLII